MFPAFIILAQHQNNRFIRAITNITYIIFLIMMVLFVVRHVNQDINFTGLLGSLKNDL